MVKVQVNGGSLFLDSGQTFHLPMEDFLKHAQIQHFSVPCKSNHSDCMDVYNNLHDFDIFVLNFTYPDRFAIWLDDLRIEMSVSRQIEGMLPLPRFEANADFLEEKISIYKDLHYGYFTNVQYNEQATNMMVDSCIALLKKHNKKFILSTCHPLQLLDQDQSYWLYPWNKSIYKNLNTDYDGHLDKDGLKLLAENIFNFGIINKTW